MPVLHDYRCPQCRKVFEKMEAWDAEKTACECGAEAVRVFLSRREYRAQAFDPVLVFRDASGHYRFPGRNSGEVPKGYEPVFLRTTAEVRKFEKQMNAKERERYMIHKEREEATYREFLGSRRSELRQRIQHMSQFGRDFAEAAMRANDEAPSADHKFDPAFHIEAFSFDSSNRDPHTDRDSGFRGRK